MSFLHPGLLWFLPLAALPLLLHFLSLRRPRRIELPTLRLLVESHQQQRRRHRLLDLLLALLRTAFLVGLVMAMSRPQWSSGLPKLLGDKGDLCVLIDRSASMQRKADDTTVFERAKHLARQLTAGGARGRRYRIYAAPPLETIADAQMHTAEEVQRKTAALACGDSAMEWKAVLKELGAALGTEPGPTTVVVLSDGQASNWATLLRETPSDGGAATGLPPSVSLRLVSCGPGAAARNRSIEATRSHDLDPLVGLPTAIEAVVRGPAETGAAVDVRLVVAGKDVARAAVELDSAGAGIARFSYVPDRVGCLDCALAMAPDEFPADDAAAFCLQVRPPLKVLLVNGKSSTDPLDDETFYVKTALAEKSMQVREVQDFELQSRPLAEADVAVLANAGGLSEQQCAWLCDAVAEGMGLLVFPGDRVDPEALNRRLLGGSATAVPLTPVRLLAAQGSIEAVATHERLAAWDLEHPALATLQQPQAKPFSSGTLYRYFPLQLPPAGAADRPGNDGAQVLARLGNKLPVLVENRCGRGKVLVAGFSLSGRQGNLPLRADFVPLIVQLLRHAAAEPDLTAPSVGVAGRRAAIALSPQVTVGTATWRGPDGASGPIEFERDDERMQARAAVRARGIHRIEVEARGRRGRNIGIDPERDGRRGAGFFDGTAPTRLETGFGGVIDPDESNFALMDGGALAAAFAPGQCQSVDPGSLENSLHAARSKDAAWPLLWLCVGVFLIEFLLCTWR